MCRSSRFLVFAGLLAVTPALGQARVGIAPVPMSPAAPRAAVRQGIVPGVNRGVMPNVNRGVLPNVRPGVMPNIRSGILPGVNRGLANGALRRPGRVRGVGSGLALAGLGLSLASEFPYPAQDPGIGGEYEPNLPIIPALEPPAPCVRPLIIKVGQGLRRRTPTRVVYGSQPGCGRYNER